MNPTPPRLVSLLDLAVGAKTTKMHHDRPPARHSEARPGPQDRIYLFEKFVGQLQS